MAQIWSNTFSSKYNQDHTVYELPTGVNYMVINGDVVAESTLVPQFMQFVEIQGSSYRLAPVYPPVVGRKFFMYNASNTTTSTTDLGSIAGCNTSTFDHNQNIGKTSLLSADGTQIFCTSPVLPQSTGGENQWIITLNSTNFSKIKALTGPEVLASSGAIGTGKTNYIWLLEDTGSYVTYIRSAASTNGSTTWYSVLFYGLYNKANNTTTETIIQNANGTSVNNTIVPHMLSTSSNAYFITTTTAISTTTATTFSLFSINKTTGVVTTLNTFSSLYAPHSAAGQRPSQALQKGSSSIYYFYQVMQNQAGNIDIARFEYDHNNPTTSAVRYQVASSYLPWITGNSLSTAIQGSALLTTSTSAYMFGGHNGTTSLASTQIANYAPTTTGQLGTWAAGTSIPMALSYSSVGQSSTGVYLIGGLSTTTVTGNIYYATQTNGVVGTWALSGFLPVPVYGAQAISTSQGIYLVGGNNGTTAVSTVYYAPLTNGLIGSWTTATIPQLPTPVAFASSVVTSAGAYIFGGQSGNGVTTATSAVYYAPITNGVLGSWQASGFLPANLSNSDAVITANGTQVLILGGNNGTSATNIVYQTNLTNGIIGSWTSPTYTLPTGVFNANAFAAQSYVNLFGGSTGATTTVVGSNALPQVPNLGSYTSSQVKGFDSTYTALPYNTTGSSTGFATFMITPTSGNQCIGVVLEEGIQTYYSAWNSTLPSSYFQMYVYQLTDATGYNAQLKSVIPINYRCRGIFPLDANYQNIILVFDNMLQFMSFDNTNLTYNTSNQSNMSIGGGSFMVDNLNRIWVMENNGNLSLMTSNVPTRVAVTFASSAYNYTGTPISTTVSAAAYDQNGASQSVAITLIIESANAVFTSNGLTTIALTAPNSTGLTINAPGYVKIAASVGV